MWRLAVTLSLVFVGWLIVPLATVGYLSCPLPQGREFVPFL